MDLKKRILSLSAAGALLVAPSAVADTPTPDKTPMRTEQKQSALPAPFRVPTDTSPREAAWMADIVTRALKNPDTARHLADISPLVEHIMLLPRPASYPVVDNQRTEMMWRTSPCLKNYIGIVMKGLDDPDKTALAFGATLAETAGYLKNHQKRVQLIRQANRTHLYLGQLVVDRDALTKARAKDPRLADISLLDGLSPGVELKHGNQLYRLRFEKVNDQTMTEDQIPILSFRTASVHAPHQERPMTQKDLDTIKKPLIAAIRGGQAAGVLPESTKEAPLIGKALRFDFLLSALMNKVFDAALPYQKVFNTTPALHQTDISAFAPVIARGDRQIEQPDEWVGFSFKAGTTTFKASIPYGCTVTQNGTKRTMNAAELAFFKKVAQSRMTPDQRARSTAFWNYFNTYVLPKTPQPTAYALLSEHKANVL